MQPGDYVAARYAPVNRMAQQTMRVTLPMADPPQLQSFAGKKGTWLVTCPDGSPQYTIQILFQQAGAAAPAANALDPPAAGDEKPIICRRSDEDFILDIDTDEWTETYWQWSGAGDSYVTITRIFPRSSVR